MGLSTLRAFVAGLLGGLCALGLFAAIPAVGQNFVNSVTVVQAVAGGTPQLAATCADFTCSILIQPQGSGAVRVPTLNVVAADGVTPGVFGTGATAPFSIPGAFYLPLSLAKAPAPGPNVMTFYIRVGTAGCGKLVAMYGTNPVETVIKDGIGCL